MRINDANKGATAGTGPIGQPDAVDPLAGRSLTREGATSSNDHVQLSHLSQRLQALGPESPERTAYLDRLSAEVSGGRYHVDPDRVAQKIVESMLTSTAEEEV